MPMIISGAVRDLRAKGVSISLLGDVEETEIKLFLRTMDYEDFVGRFYGSLPLSPSGKCVAAAARMMAEDLVGLSPGQVMDLRLSDEDSVVVLKTCQYEPSQLPLSDGGMLIAARAGKSQDEIVQMAPAEVMDLGLCDEDSIAVLKMYRFEIAGKGMTVGAEGAQVTNTAGDWRCAAGPRSVPQACTGRRSSTNRAVA